MLMPYELRYNHIGYCHIITSYVFVHDDHIDINYTCTCDHICDKARKV